MMLDDIAAYLAEQNIGKVGTSIFRGSMPDMPDNCIVVYEYAGSPPDLALDGTEIEQPGLQVRVRNKSYSAGRAVIESVITALSPMANKYLSGTFYLSIIVNQSPAPLAKDARGRQEWAVNFSVRKERR